MYIYIHAYGTWFNTYCEYHSSTNHDIKSSKSINTNHFNFRYNMFKMMSQRKVYFNDSQWSATPVILDFPIAILRVFNITRSPRVIHQEPIIHQSYSLVVTHQEWSSSSMFPHLQHPQITPTPVCLLPRNEGSWLPRWLRGESATKKCRRISIRTTALMSYHIAINFSATVLQCNTLIHWRRYFWDILIFERVWRCPAVLNSYQDLQTSSTEVTKALFKRKNPGSSQPPNSFPHGFLHPHRSTSRGCSKGIWGYRSNFAYSPRISSPRPAAQNHGRGSPRTSGT